MIHFLEENDLVLMILGLAALGVVGLPKLLGDRPISYPIIYVGAGALLFSLPLGFTDPDPIEFRRTTEALTEIGVITALMGAGLAINRRPTPAAWATTWRLLGVTMPLTIAAIASFGIRGVGSFCYLAYASNQVEFLQVEQVWAVGHRPRGHHLDRRTRDVGHPCDGLH